MTDEGILQSLVHNILNRTFLMKDVDIVSQSNFVIFLFNLGLMNTSVKDYMNKFASKASAVMANSLNPGKKVRESLSQV
jgi:hypothetical protein